MEKRFKIGSYGRIEYNDGNFENGFASTNGGYGLAQLFNLDDFPGYTYPFGIYEIGYYVDDYLNYQQQEEIYVLNGDGSVILDGPYCINYDSPGYYSILLCNPPVIEEGNFMIATINTFAGGPFIGVDDSYYNETLYFGTIGDWTELGELGAYYYVGSHWARVNSPNWNYPDRFNLYRKSIGEDFIKLNDSLLTESEYIDTIPHNSICTYYVTGVYEGCESDSSNNVIIDSFVNIENIAIDHTGISISPNPADESVTIHISGESDEGFTICIYDLSGKKVYSDTGFSNDRFSLIIDVSAIQTGIYIVRFSTMNNLFTGKLIIHH